MSYRFKTIKNPCHIPSDRFPFPGSVIKSLHPKNPVFSSQVLERWQERKEIESYKVKFVRYYIPIVDSFIQIGNAGLNNGLKSMDILHLKTLTVILIP